MSCSERLRREMRLRGIRITPQRSVILETVSHLGGHPSATEVYREAARRLPGLNPATVYRTLGVLKELRLATETDMGTGDTSYEWVRQQGRHHHLICRQCGSVASLDHRFLEDLGAEIMAESGFRPDIEHFAIFGVCATCQEKPLGVSLNGD